MQVAERNQISGTALMIEPTSFGLNPQTAESNKFQLEQLDEDEGSVRRRAVEEFEHFTHQLREEEIRVIVCPSRKDIIIPDATFPNNWISFHNGKVVLYPMMAPNRREERQFRAVREKLAEVGIQIEAEPIDLTYLEENGDFLEGTGSLVLDRESRIAYASLSPRTTKRAVEVFAERMDYDPVIFRSVDRDGEEIYHTNVVMSIGEEFGLVCLESIVGEEDRQRVADRIRESGKQLIEIGLDQLHQFGGNILQMQSIEEERKIIMSTSAFESYRSDQRQALENHGDLLIVNIPTIERVGGGSSRCMIAEVFA